MTAQSSIKFSPEDAASIAATPTEQEIRRWLSRMLASNAFVTSPRNRRFFNFIVEETLADRGDRIKAYNIALAAFDRSSDFDPLTDPIVRIEASRLRRSGHF